MKLMWIKRWRVLPLLCLCALLYATPAGADFVGMVPLNCHQMAELTFGANEEAALMGAGENAVEQTLSGYFTAREAAYRGDVRLLSGDDLNMSASVAETNALRTQRVREMEERLGISVLDADVTTRVERERTTKNSDGSLTLYVYEWTYYDYDDLSDGAGGRDVSGFGTWHILTVAQRPDKSWQILADEFDESDLFGMNTLSEERVQELMERGVEATDFGSVPPEPVDEEAASLQALSYSTEYNVSKAVEYSETYWQNYNPAYANFNSAGGDCANFTSQSIAAGDMPQVVCQPYGSDGWYYKTAADRSATWTGSTAMRKWFAENRGHLVTASKATVYTGSPVFYSTKGNSSFQHTVLCVGKSSAGTPIVNSHNSDRWHVLWNYYAGSVVIDTVQLTSNTFGSFAGYMTSIGTDFYAYIVNPFLNRYITNDGGGTVTSRARAQSAPASQVWHFLRQDDGSYQILSVLKDTLSNPSLAVQNSAWDSRTPICTEPYTGKAADSGQLWYLYQDSQNSSKGRYYFQLRPKCSDRVMDIVEGSDAEGTGLWLFSKNGSQAQSFQLYQTQWVELDTPVLEYDLENTEGQSVKFYWEKLNGAGSYTIRVTKDNHTIRTVTVKELSYGMTLEPGTYTATLEAVSTNEQTSSMSDPVTFTVSTSFPVTYDANGGEGAPAAQLKLEYVDVTLSEEIPTYEGYTFFTWNTHADGTGDSYAPGTVYNKDEPLTLYARWTPNTYKLTLNPNTGSVDTPEREVTYHEPYGELPVPELKDNEFVGWFTQLIDGEQVTAESIVNVAEDQTLYAHWVSTIAYISSIVAKTGDYYMVRTTYYRVDEGLLFVCGYRDGRLEGVVTAPIGAEEELTLQGDFDVIRVMALDNENHRPLCPANVITRDRFR